jgi:heme A synthase
MGATALLQALGAVDPAPLFALSLAPYLLFLWWSWRSGRMPRLAFWGFCLTLLFVLVTIAAALVAEGVYGRQLADVDPLHGGAEAVLTLSNLLVLMGFRQAAAGPGAVNKS